VAPFLIGVGMCGPTLVDLGTPEQKARYLRPLLRGEEIWCQLFSEPGAGSDVAGLSTRAVRDDEGWLLSGQKVWTSVAQWADFGAVLARTDPGRTGTWASRCSCSTCTSRGSPCGRWST